MKRWPAALFSLMVLTTGCSHYYYAPNMQNVPLFHEKNEVRATVAATTSDELNGTELQAAYSLTDHIGIMANFMTVNGGDAYNSGKGRYGEGGAGYYLPFAEKGVFEIYGGFGGGKAVNYYDASSWSDLRLNKYFVQPGIGFSTDYFDAVISVRVALLHYTSIRTSNPNSNIPEDVYYIVAHRNSLLYEPGITLRGGWKYIKLQTQWHASFNGTSPDLQQEKSAFNIGLYFSFAQRFMDLKKAPKR